MRRGVAYANKGRAVNDIAQDIKDYIDTRDTAVEQRIKYWLISAVLAQVIALAPVVFFLGGIYSNANASLKMLENQQVELSQRGVWMQDRERWEQAMQIWAEDQGFKPPRYKRD